MRADTGHDPRPHIPRAPGPAPGQAAWRAEAAGLGPIGREVRGLLVLLCVLAGLMVVTAAAGVLA